MREVRQRAVAWVYDLLVVAGVALIAAGLWTVAPAPALVWLGASLIFAVRYGRA